VLLGLPLHGALAADAAATDTQAAPAGAAAAQSSDTLQEVLVTATHRSESERDVPVSTSALSGDPLTVLGTGGGDIKQLAFAVPSLNIESSNGRAFPRLYIRGYGNTDYHDFASQPVGLVYDDIDQENAALKGFPVFDQQDVEVLRGPQGTLFGRNAPAGVVKFESAKPELNSTDGFISIADGTFNTGTIQVVDNIPIGTDQAVRVSLQGQHRDGWVNDPVNQDTYGGFNDWAARVQWLLKLSDSFSMLVNVHGHSMDGSSTLFRANIFSQGTNSLVPGFNPAYVYSDGPNRQDLGTIGANVHLTWSLPSFTVQSISGYESVQRYMSLGDIDGGYGPGNVFCQPGCAGVAPSGPGYIPFAVETSAGLLHHEQFTQEFRVLTEGDGPLQGQAGVYAFYEDVTADDDDYCVPGATGAAATPGTACATETLWQLQDTTISNQRNNAEAVFGSLSYTVIDPLKLTAGVRYTHDDKNFKLVYSDTVPAPSPPNSASAVANNVSWDVSGLYKLTKDINAYARVATGFRAPSFGSPAAGLPIQVARSETNTSYETGIKADLLDHTVHVDWDVYYYEVKNQQLSAVGGVTNTTLLLNATKTYGRGTELQLDYHPVAGLTFSLAGSVNVTRIDDPGLAVGPCFNWSFAAPTAACTLINPVNAAGDVLINGNPLPEAAKYVGDFSVRYDYALPNNAGVYVYSDVQSRSSMLATLYESKEFTLPNLTQVGLRFGYLWANGKYEVAAYCRNCVNEVRQVGVIDFADFLGYVNDPRIFGMSFKSNF